MDEATATRKIARLETLADLTRLERSAAKSGLILVGKFSRGRVTSTLASDRQQPSECGQITFLVQDASAERGYRHCRSSIADLHELVEFAAR